MLFLFAVIIMKSNLQGSAFLLAATLIWGTSFVSQSVGMDHIGPFSFQSIRCAMAVIALLPVIWLGDRKKKDGKTFLSRFADKKLWIGGILCAIPLFFAINLQQIGIIYTTAGKSAFLTAMYIVFVPVIEFFMGKKVSPMIPVSVILAVVGLYFLSCMGVTQVNIGDLFLIGCAVCFAIQIIVVEKYAPDVDALRLNCLQAGICSILSAPVMLFAEAPALTDIWAAFFPLCFSGIMSMGAGYSLQILGQQKLEAALASLIMSLESVFAVLAGWLLLQETLTPWESNGCVLVFAAVIFSQLKFRHRKKRI